METLAHPERSGGEQRAAADRLLHADEQHPGSSGGVPAIHIDGRRHFGYPEIRWWAGWVLVARAARLLAWLC